MEQEMSHSYYPQREPDLFEEVGDGQCCWTESGKVAHVFAYAHPLKAFFLSLIPCPVTFFLCQVNENLVMLETHVLRYLSHVM